MVFASAYYIIALDQYITDGLKQACYFLKAISDKILLFFTKGPSTPGKTTCMRSFPCLSNKPMPSQSAYCPKAIRSIVQFWRAWYETKIDQQWHLPVNSQEIFIALEGLFPPRPHLTSYSARYLCLLFERCSHTQVYSRKVKHQLSACHMILESVYAPFWHVAAILCGES